MRKEFPIACGNFCLWQFLPAAKAAPQGAEAPEKLCVSQAHNVLEESQEGVCPSL